MPIFIKHTESNVAARRSLGYNLSWQFWDLFPLVKSHWIWQMDSRASRQVNRKKMALCPPAPLTGNYAKNVNQCLDRPVTPPPDFLNFLHIQKQKYILNVTRVLLKLKPSLCTVLSSPWHLLVCTVFHWIQDEYLLPQHYVIIFTQVF